MNSSLQLCYLEVYSAVYFFHKMIPNATSKSPSLQLRGSRWPDPLLWNSCLFVSRHSASTFPTQPSLWSRSQLSKTWLFTQCWSHTMNHEYEKKCFHFSLGSMAFPTIVLSQLFFPYCKAMVPLLVTSLPCGFVYGSLLCSTVLCVCFKY